jgi:anti-anti-sigma factor
MTPSFSRSVTDFEGFHFVALRGELDLATADGLVDWLLDIAGSSVVIDLAGLTFMDSSGIAVMIQAKNQLGDAVVFTRPHPNVRQVLEITGLTDLLTEWNPAWSHLSKDHSHESADGSHDCPSCTAS